ncbi:hypothetical protein KJ359_006375 [Pestalotiopsis sp. 9143b]|nr:hypothetical protein KJ359_006375 [Pestalotiopsis sp. 9143b]
MGSTSFGNLGLKTSTAGSSVTTDSDHTTATAIPDKKGSRAYRWLRWNFGSVYRRIFAVAFFANLAVLVGLAAAHRTVDESYLTYDACATAVSSNLLVSLIVRNEHFVNTIFFLFGHLPKRAPLGVRRVIAKVYSYGGLHSGCNVSATVWYILYLILLTQSYLQTRMSALQIVVLAFSYTIICLLVAILVCAHPHMRGRFHNSFENTHRFFGWSIILLFWTVVLLLAKVSAVEQDVSMGAAAIRIPSFWNLIFISLFVVYPWLNLRLREVETEVLSSHAAEFKFKHANVQYGQAVRLSDAPLRETHAFAVIPNVASSAPPSGPSSQNSSSTDLEKQTPPAPPTAGDKGFSILMSNAGDWTKRMIQDPPKKIWIRGLPQFGVIRVAGLFSPVTIVATGSGIGPCLSLFVQTPDHPVRIIWSARSPETTYGQKVIDVVRRADPHALILDTKTYGRPDLVTLAYRKWAGQEDHGTEGCEGDDKKPRAKSEAVVIISNQKVTEKVVYGLEARGVPAYGAIFDS